MTTQLTPKTFSHTAADTRNEPAYRVSDPHRTTATVTVLPETGGIFCSGGSDVLRCGADIKSSAGWDVYFVSGPGSEVHQLDASEWAIMTESPSVPCVCGVDILANVGGKAYTCTRVVTFANVGADDPVGPVVMPASLPNGYMGVEYTQTFRVSNAPQGTDFFWTVPRDHPLPDGFSLDAWTGTLKGSRDEAVTLPITIVALELGGDQYPARFLASRTYTLKIVDPSSESVIKPETLPTARVGEAYDVQMEVTNVDPSAAVRWGVMEKDVVPDWLDLDVYTGELSGTPDEEGAYDFRVWAWGVEDEKLETLAKRDYHLSAVGIPTIVTKSLPDGKSGKLYDPFPIELSTSLPEGYEWMLFPPSKPDWLSIGAQSGVLVGTGLAVYRATPYTVTIIVAKHDGADIEDILTYKTFDLRISAVSGTITSSSPLPTAVSGTPYVGVTLAVDPPKPADTVWRILGRPSDGTMDWLSIDEQTGVLSGTPTGITADFDAEFTAVVEYPATAMSYAEKPMEITVKAVGSAPTPAPEPAILPKDAALPDARVGEKYSVDFRLENAPKGEPLHWLCTSSFIPGLSLDENTGRVTGIPDATGTFDVSITASRTDKPADHIASTSYYGTVKPAPAILGDSELPFATDSLEYTHEFETEGIDDGAVWSATGLPTGLEIDDETGTISGTISVLDGDFRMYRHTVTVSVQNPDNTSTQRVFVMESGRAVRIAPEVLPNGEVGVEYTRTVLQPDGVYPGVAEEWHFDRIEGSLPDGLTVSNDGAITGTPSAEGDAWRGVYWRDFEFEVVFAHTRTADETTQKTHIGVYNPVEGLAITTARTLPIANAGATTTYALHVHTDASPENFSEFEWRVDGTEGACSATLENKTGFSAQLVVEVDPTVPADNPYLRITVVWSAYSIRASQMVSDTAVFTIPVRVASAVPTILTTSLPPAYDGIEYTADLQASSTAGSAAVVWELVPGSFLPAGLTLGLGGHISGHIAAEETGKTHTLAVSATNQYGTVQGTVNLPAGGDFEGPVRLRNIRSIPAPMHGQPYSATIAVLLGEIADGTDIDPFAVDGLPSGLALMEEEGNPRVCRVSGIAVDHWDQTRFNLVPSVEIGPGDAYSSTVPLSWNPAPAGTFFTKRLPNGRAGVMYLEELLYTPTGGGTYLSISQDTPLPEGLDLLVKPNESTSIKGTPLAAFDGDIDINITVNGVTRHAATLHLVIEP